jgi:hypothetical protein
VAALIRTGSRSAASVDGAAPGDRTGWVRSRPGRSNPARRRSRPGRSGLRPSWAGSGSSVCDGLAAGQPTRRSCLRIAFRAHPPLRDLAEALACPCSVDAPVTRALDARLARSVAVRSPERGQPAALEPGLVAAHTVRRAPECLSDLIILISPARRVAPSRKPRPSCRRSHSGRSEPRLRAPRDTPSLVRSRQRALIPIASDGAVSGGNSSAGRLGQPPTTAAGLRKRTAWVHTRPTRGGHALVSGVGSMSGGQESCAAREGLRSASQKLNNKQ